MCCLPPLQDVLAEKRARETEERFAAAGRDCDPAEGLSDYLQATERESSSRQLVKDLFESDATVGPADRPTTIAYLFKLCKQGLMSLTILVAPSHRLGAAIKVRDLQGWEAAWGLLQVCGCAGGG